MKKNKSYLLNTNNQIQLLGVIIACVLAILFISPKTIVAQTGEFIVPEPSPQAENQGYQTYDSLLTLYQPYLKNIAVCQPIYFLIGTNPKKSKFQFSFKYQLVDLKSEDSEQYSWVEGFYFAFTQTSFWDLESDSKPFEDTGYKPEVFFVSPNVYKGNCEYIRAFLKTGLQHESNGKSDESSRSSNFPYIEPIVMFFDAERSLGLQISSKLWGYFKNDNDTNSDLKDYRGYFDLGLKFGKLNSFVFESRFRPAKMGNSIELNLTYPLDINNFQLYLQVQYSNVLAESLLNYRERNEALRLGFTVIR